MLFFLGAIVLWNIIVFGMYGWDKSKAKRNQWRISEFVLISSAFLFGGTGAFVGVRTFRHKTKHKKFIILIPISIVFNIILVWAVFLLVDFLNIPGFPGH